MIKIVGTGSYLPEKIMSNFDLEKLVETSDEWISKRTGIKERRIASENESTSDLAFYAARQALQMANLLPENIELIIVGTSTADYPIPACAPIVQAKLGCGKIPAFDINSVCTSFSYSFLTAYSMVANGLYDNCLIIGADIYSRILNWKDRNTCVIFGDGAGAMIIKKDNSKKGILSYQFGADGNDAELIKIPVGGSKYPGHDLTDYLYGDLFFQMEGKKVYEFTINVIPEIAENLVKKANMKPTDVDWIVLHQANLRIIDTVAKRLELPLEKFIVNIERVGNTSSGSIPIAIDEAVRSNKIKSGDKVMFIGFGGGLSWGGLIVEW
ncbi:MAG TPA: beta-ketoacyl-ACP synthase III [Spirochaetota bacterium]|nr:beta-ketoacyl-ACP synthase III [Spirochaetota bacterium]